MIKKRRLEYREFPTKSIIAPDTKIEGTIIRSSSIRISGYFKGRINSDRLIILDKGGKIDGMLNAPRIIINGELNGDIDSAELVELRTECRMIGDINTGKIAIAEGSIFHGEIKTIKKKDITSTSESDQKFSKIKEKVDKGPPEEEEAKKRLAGLRD